MLDNGLIAIAEAINKIPYWPLISRVKVQKICDELVFEP